MCVGGLALSRGSAPKLRSPFVSRRFPRLEILEKDRDKKLKESGPYLGKEAYLAFCSELDCFKKWPDYVDSCFELILY